MPDQPTNNRTIARNTLMLYGRALLMMLIGLYTSRVILHTLGITDFGIYNAVGGIIGLFGVVTGSLSNATSRFITVAIGKGDQEITNKTFGNIKVIYYALCFLVVILGETIGLWFLYHKMTIPADRMTAAFWIYQFTIVSAVLNFICIPYNSAIIAHEKMSAFAYISLLDAVFKLLICYLLIVIPFDKLIVYSTLIFCVGIVDRIIYAIYCERRFEEVKAKPRIFRKQFREIVVLSGWALSGNIAYVSYTQGLNILLNIFFGPVVNAARGVALQVQGVIGQFVSNFQTAINPQITKSYAAGNFERMHQLFNFSSKYSFFLLFFLSLPVVIEAPYILGLWLVKVPQHTVSFLRIIFVYEWVQTLAGAYNTSVLATGNMKWFQIVDGIIRLSIFPSCYVLLKFFNEQPESVFVVLAISEVFSVTAKTFIVLPMIHYKKVDYLKEVIFPIIAIFLLSSVVPILIIGIMKTSFVRLVCVVLTSWGGTSFFIWNIGLNKHEKLAIKDMIIHKLLIKTGLVHDK